MAESRKKIRQTLTITCPTSGHTQLGVRMEIDLERKVMRFKHEGLGRFREIPIWDVYALCLEKDARTPRAHGKSDKNDDPGPDTAETSPIVDKTNDPISLMDIT
jgi:hypothetical protein